jgi:hypothetical protein
MEMGLISPCIDGLHDISEGSEGRAGWVEYRAGLISTPYFLRTRVLYAFSLLKLITAGIYTRSAPQAETALMRSPSRLECRLDRM